MANALADRPRAHHEHRFKLIITTNHYRRFIELQPNTDSHWDLLSLALLFQLVTLPVEFNASRRALQILSDGQVLTRDEVPMVRKVLVAAALTYVAAALSTFLQLLRLIILFGGNRDDN